MKTWLGGLAERLIWEMQIRRSNCMNSTKKRSAVTCLAGFLIAVGFCLQMAIPLHIIELPGERLFGMPTEIAGLYLATALILIGIVLVFISYAKPLAEKLDAEDRE